MIDPDGIVITTEKSKDIIKLDIRPPCDFEPYDLEDDKSFNNFIADIEKEVSKIYSVNKKLKSTVFELTYKCSEKCKHCYVVDENKKELTTEEVKRVLDQLKEEGVFFITFTGGDPFCRKDFIAKKKEKICEFYIVQIYIWIQK